MLGADRLFDLDKEFQSLLAARQRDEEMIQKLVTMLEKLLPDLEMRDDFNEIYQQVNAAELRLKEGVL